MNILKKFFSKNEKNSNEEKVKKTIIVDGEEVELDEEAVEFLSIYEKNIKNAENGDGRAQLLVGKALYNYAENYWYGISRVEEAVEWLKKAADKEYGAAYTYLGLYYSNSDFENVNYLKAMELFSKAAELNDAEGYYYTGRAYKYGEGVEADMFAAFEYFFKAADMGNSDAMEEVGIAYYEGNVIEEDKEKAFQYLSDSYEIQSSYHAHDFYYYLVQCYMHGIGTDKQPEKAVKILKEKCKGSLLASNSDLINILIYCYENGIGTPVNYEEASKLRSQDRKAREIWSSVANAVPNSK